MAKLLLLVVVGAAVYFILRGYARALGKGRDEQNKAIADEDMVRCAHCGVHLPKGEATCEQNGVFFCSDEHRRVHRG